MVGLVIETPLANDNVCASILDLLNHLGKLFTLVVLQALEFIDRSDVELVLGLGLRGFECTSQNGQLGILDLRRHLRV